MAPGQRTAKSGGRPGAKRCRRGTAVTNVSSPGLQVAVRKRQPKRAKRPHSTIQRPQGAGRPCYEAGNSACRGEWRREAGSPARVRLMSAWERESGELPAPNLPPSSRKTGRGLFVLLKPHREERGRASPQIFNLNSKPAPLPLRAFALIRRIPHNRRVKCRALPLRRYRQSAFAISVFSRGRKIHLPAPIFLPSSSRTSRRQFHSVSFPYVLFPLSWGDLLGKTCVPLLRQTRTAAGRRCHFPFGPFPRRSFPLTSKP